MAGSRLLSVEYVVSDTSRPSGSIFSSLSKSLDEITIQRIGSIIESDFRFGSGVYFIDGSDKAGVVFSEGIVLGVRSRGTAGGDIIWESDSSGILSVSSSTADNDAVRISPSGGFDFTGGLFSTSSDAMIGGASNRAALALPISSTTTQEWAMEVRVKVDDIANCGLAFGIVNSDPLALSAILGSNDDLVTTSKIYAFRKKESDGTIVIESSDGGGNSTTLKTLTQKFVNNGFRNLGVLFSNGNLKFFVDGDEVHSASPDGSTSLPTGDFAPAIALRNATASSPSRKISFDWIRFVSYDRD